MSIDYTVHLTCDVKLTLGEGDVVAGEGKLLQSLKAQGRARILQKIAREQGKDVQSMRATVKDVDEHGQPQNVEIRYTDLVQQFEPLLALQSLCATCPANALRRHFGCQGALKYPIRKKSEQWLLNKVQSLDTVAGPYLIQAFADGDEGLAQIQGMRQNGLFESKHPLSRVVGVDRSSEFQIDSDSVFETFLGRGDALDPNYCVMLLLGLGAINLDGKPATSAEGFGAVLSMEVSRERQRRTAFGFPPDPDSDILALQSLLRAMFYSWQNDVLFLISV
jgi:hypothetical protein